MTHLYASNTGNDSNNGLTWATAKATRAAAVAAASYGDTVWLHPAYDENHTGSTAVIVNVPQGVALRCAADTNEPPTPGGTTAQISAEAPIGIYGEGEVHGVTFASDELIEGMDASAYECRFELGDNAGGFAPAMKYMGNCWFKFGHAAQYIYGKGQIESGGIDPAGVEVDGLFIATGGMIRANAFDASHASGSLALLKDSDEYGVLFARDVETPTGTAPESLHVKLMPLDTVEVAPGSVTVNRIY